MNWPAILNSESAQHLLLALCHTLWQGALIAALLFLILRRTPASRPDFRYLVSLFCLVALVLCGSATWSILEAPSEAPKGMTQDESASPAIVSASVEPSAGESPVTPGVEPVEGSRTASNRNFFGGWTPILLTLWFVGVLAMLLHTAQVFLGAGRLISRCSPLMDESIIAQVENLRRKLGIAQRIGVAAGEIITSPAVVGVFRVTILLPVSVVTGFSPDDLRTILAHEAAHIRRYDHVVNFLQMLIESLLFFNPAVWWISRRVRIERESACDALAIRVTGSSDRDYAEVLARAAERFMMFRQAGVLGISGTSGDRDGSLLDRVKRLVLPGYRPETRVSWKMLATMFVLGFLLIGSLGKGMFTVVERLSPKERQEKLVEIEKTHGARDLQSEDTSFEISGMVLAPDGSVLPGNPRVYMSNKASHVDGVMPVGYKNGRFVCRARPGLIWLWVKADDKFAFTSVGPIEATPENPPRDIKIVLNKGFEGRIKVTDTDGAPVVGSEIGLSGVFGNSSPEVYSKAYTDREGIASIPNCSTESLRITVRAEGFEREEKKGVSIKPAEPYVCRLNRSVPASGIVRSRDNGLPIPGATFHLIFSRDGGSNYMAIPEDSAVFTQTDGEGRFYLNELGKEPNYIFLVRAEGHAPTLLRTAAAGAKDLLVEMGPEISVSGKVIWPRNFSGDKSISYSNTIAGLSNGTWAQEGRNIRTTQEDNVSRFEITGLWEGGFQIHAGADRSPVYAGYVNESLTDLLFDLSEEYGKGETRPVLIRMKIPQGMPDPSCTLRLDASPMDQRVQPSRNITLDEKGEARVELPVPCKLSIRWEKGIGYWFKEVRMDVPAGETEMPVSIKAVPAGAIYGQILEKDGTPARDVLASLIEVEESPEMDYPFIDLPVEDSPLDQGKYNASPLPLGGKYRIAVRRKSTMAVGPVLRVDDEKAIHEINLTMPEGITMKGKIELPDGRPASGYKVGLDAQIGNHGYSLEVATTNEEGYYSFDNVNDDLDGQYHIDVYVLKTYQPVRKDMGPKRNLPTIRLEPGLVFTGRILENGTDCPIPGVEVNAFNGDNHLFSTESDTNERGEFRFSNLAPGQYRFSINNVTFPQGTPESERTFSPTESNPITLRVDIHPGSSLTSIKPPKSDAPTYTPE